METVIRVVIIYLFVMIGLRVLGKREFGQMSPLELITLLLIPELVSNAAQREDYSIVDAMVAVATLLSLTLLTSIVLHKSKKAEQIIAGTPVVLVQSGHLVADTMNLERVTPDEICDAMHKAGLDRFAQIRWAILETDGNITVIPEESDNPNALDRSGGTA